jgi:SOS response regulatory protein OraA/RecX
MRGKTLATKKAAKKAVKKAVKKAPAKKAVKKAVKKAAKKAEEKEVTSAPPQPQYKASKSARLLSRGPGVFASSLHCSNRMASLRAEKGSCPSTEGELP